MQKGASKWKLTLAVLAALSAVFTIGGCMAAKADDPKMETIERVLELQFNGPDEEFLEAMWNPANKQIVNGVEVNEAFEQQVDDKYGAYFTDSELDQFMRVFGTYFPGLADIYGYELRLEDVDIELSETVANRYLFTAEVAFQKKGGKEQRAEVGGVVLFSTVQEGKIGKFTYTDDQGLSERLKQ